jgi:hypothetical protein
MTFTSRTTVPLPAAAVWNLLLDCGTWQSWWGESLLRVDPRWGRGGQLCWSLGGPSTIVEFEARERLTFEGFYSRSQFTLSEVGTGATLVTLEEDYLASRGQVTDPAAKQTRCDTIIRNLDRYARAHAQQYARAHTEVATSSECVAALIAKDLTHDNENVRCAAVGQLVESGSPDAIDLLVHALTDYGDKVRLTAARGLSGLGWTPPDAKTKVAFLVAAQKWDDLAALGPEGVHALVSLHLIQAGRYTNDPVSRAMDRLVKMGSTAVTPLVEILRLKKDLPVSDSDKWTAVYAAEVLGRIGDSAAIDVLVEALGSENEPLRSSAAEALSKIGDKRAIEPIRAASKGGGSPRPVPTPWSSSGTRR